MNYFGKVGLITSVAAMALSGCMDPDGTYNKIGNSAMIGTAVGGLVGRRLADDEDKARGTMIGAAVGGALGGAVGYQLEQQERELRASSVGRSGASIVNTGDRLVVTLPEAITFPVNGTAVKPSLMQPLADLARSINNYPNTFAQIVGHTDSTGSNAYNMDLSNRRAASVASHLTGNGVPYNRVNTVGMGEDYPIASNSTDAGRQQNRRVEINIIPRTGG